MALKNDHYTYRVTWSNGLEGMGQACYIAIDRSRAAQAPASMLDLRTRLAPVWDVKA